MASTVIVGRVGVRVYPDTSRFAKELRDQLRDEVRDAERGLDKVEVEAKLDVKSLARELAKAMRQMERQAKRNPIEVDTRVSDSDPYDYLGEAIKQGKELSSVLRQQQNIEGSIRRENEKATRAETALLRERQSVADKLAKAQLKYASEHERANAQLDKSIREYDRYLRKISRTAGNLPGQFEEARRELQRMQQDRARVGFNIDLSGIEEYKDQVRKLKDWTEDEFDNIEAELQPQVSEPMYRRAQQRLAWLARSRIVTFIPQVSAAGAAKAATALAAISGARMVGENLRSLREFFKDVDKNLPKIALLATGFVNLTAAILSTSSNLFALSSSLAQIAPIALALPGLFTGFALGLVSLIRPLMDTNEVLPELKKNWEATGKEMSKNFWAKAKKPWQEMIKTIFPEFRKGMADTSSEMGDLAGEFGVLFAQANVNGPMNRMFADLAESIRIAKNGAAGLAQAIVILGEKGAGLLPRLSGYFVDVTNRFSDFLQKSDENGKLDEWIDRSIFQMKELGNVIYEAGRILGGLGRAAEKAGGSTLSTLADTLKRIADAVNSVDFQRQLVDTLVAAEKAMTNISDIAGPRVYEFFKTLGATLETILPVAGEIAGVLLGELADALTQTAVHRGVIDLFDGILAAAKLLTPAFRPLGEAFGVFLSLLGQLATSFAPLLTVALTTVAKMFTALAPSIGSTADALSAGLLAVFKELSPVLVSLAEKLGPVLVKLGEGLGQVLKDNAPLLGELAEVLGTALIDAIDQLATHLPDIVDNLLPQLLEVAKEIVPQLPMLVGGFLELVKSITETDLIPELGRLVGSLLELVESDVLPSLARDIPLVAQSMTDLASALSAITDGANSLNILQGLWTVLSALNQIASIFNPARILMDIVNGFKEGLANGDWNQFWWDLAMTPVNIVKKALGINSPSTVFAEIGRNVIQGLLNGVGELVGAVITKFTALATSIKNVFTGGATWLLDRGRQIAGGLITGVGERISAAKTKATELRTAVRDVFNGASDLLLSAGKNIAQGLANGIRDGISWVTSAARSIARAAVDAAKDALRIASPSRVMAELGAFVSIGLAEGILSERGTVENAMASLVDSVKGTDFSIAPNIDVGLTARSGKAVDNALDTGDDSGDGVSAPIVMNVTNYNPVAEPTSVTTTRTLREAQSMGVTL